MKRQKGIAGMTVAIVVLVAVLVSVMFGAPTVAIGFVNQMMGVQSNCEDDPYNAKCICDPVGQRRISVPWLGVPKWDCETMELLILDPDSPAFNTEAIAFTQNYLSYYCGSVCTDLSCGNMKPCVMGGPPAGEERCIDATYSWTAGGERTAFVRCLTASKALWHMHFFVESPTDTPQALPVMHQHNYCLSPDGATLCATEKDCADRGGEDWCKPMLPVEIVEAGSLLEMLGI